MFIFACFVYSDLVFLTTWADDQDNNIFPGLQQEEKFWQQNLHKFSLL